jgi:nucleotide-binding universal stress UspA family protein
MEAKKEIFQEADFRIRAEIIIGPRWKVINNYAKENNIDLIIMGSHGVRNEAGDISIGTTSHKVMFSSPCPVLIVRHEVSPI